MSYRKLRELVRDMRRRDETFELGQLLLDK